MKIFGRTCDIEIWDGDMKVLVKGIWVAIGGLRGHGFGARRQGSHEAKNKASKATKN